MPKALDHDPPTKDKLAPLGVLMIATGMLTRIFGRSETSDSWIDALKLWWTGVRDRFPRVRQLVIYLDNGPNNSHRATPIPQTHDRSSPTGRG